MMKLPEFELAGFGSCAKEAEQVLKRSTHVNIILSNETGNERWVVVPDADVEFWLGAFETKKQALSFCKKCKWKVEEGMLNDVNGG